MATSLDKLVDNLPKDAFNNVKRYYADDKLSLLTKKCIYPYEYMNLSEKLKETQLPPKEAIYSRLNDEMKVLVMRISRMQKSLENVRNEKPRRLP